MVEEGGMEREIGLETPYGPTSHTVFLFLVYPILSEPMSMLCFHAILP